MAENEILVTRGPFLLLVVQVLARSIDWCPTYIMIKHVATSVVIIVSIYLLLFWGDMYVAIVITFDVMTVNANMDYFFTFSRPVVTLKVTSHQKFWNLN